MGPLIGNCSNLVIFKKNIVIFKANLVIFRTNIVIFWTKKKDYDKFSHIRELKDQISNWGYLYPIGDNITNRTGFKFMANKQFRMEKNWEHQCALISHTMFSKTNMFNFYRKKLLN